MTIINIFHGIGYTLLGGSLIAFILSYVGTFAVLRRMSFFGDGIAHVSLLGIAIGLVTATNPLWSALAVTIIFALLMFVLERKTNLAFDAVIGIIFPFAMAVGISLLALRKAGEVDLEGILFGDINAVQKGDLAGIIIVAVLAILFLITYMRQLTFIAFDREGAEVAGIHTSFLDAVFYVVVAVSVVLGVKMAGVIMVSALLVIPTATGKLLAKSFEGMLSSSVLFAELGVLLGIGVALFWPIPAGAAIIIVSTLIFFASLGVSKLRKA